MAFYILFISLLIVNIIYINADQTCNGTVVVNSGETLRVHSSPTTSSSILYSLSNSVSFDHTCITNGELITGSQGTTDIWYEINHNGYSSAAYMYHDSTCTPVDCSTNPDPDPNSTFEMALNYGTSNIGTIYVGCAGGNYRFGVVAPYDMYHDGTTCGQSRVYFQPKVYIYMNL